MSIVVWLGDVSWYINPCGLFNNKPYISRGVMIIVVGNGHGDTSSNTWTKPIAFHIALIPLGKVWIQLFSLQLWVNSRTGWVLQPW